MTKPVGEPDAGNPHVRFDERGWETERCRMAQATAPILDSTYPELRCNAASRRVLKALPTRNARGELVSPCPEAVIDQASDRASMPIQPLAGVVIFQTAFGMVLRLRVGLHETARVHRP